MLGGGLDVGRWVALLAAAGLGLIIQLGATAATPLPPVEPIDSSTVQPAIPAMKPLVFDPHIQSVQLRRSTKVLAEPRRNAVKIGRIAAGTRVKWKGATKNNDCRYRWLQIEPHGWICARVKPSTKPPTTTLHPKVDEGSVLPGVYGRVRRSTDVRVYSSRADVRAEGGEVTTEMKLDVRRRRVVWIRGKKYWRVQGGKLVRSRHVYRLKGSTFQGIDLSGKTVTTGTIAWAQRRYGRTRRVYVRSRASRRSRVVDKLAPRTVVSITGTSANERYKSIGPNRWVRTKDLRIVKLVEPPAEVGLRDRWVDVDLSSRVLVAYVGKTPQYATLVATGKWKWPTPRGQFRVVKKYARSTMRSPFRDEVYNVGDVPWVLYFRKGYALHGAYWHNGYGARRSHGCVNLAPLDAAKIYSFLGPHTPPGWTAVYAHPGNPGAVVRIRRGKR